jgi:hypothetical protein
MVQMVWSRWWLVGFCGLALVVFAAACGSAPEFVVAGQDRDGNPLEYRYLDERTVEVKYLAGTYRLTPGTQHPAPFAYLFGKNGSCELLFGDFRIDIANPFQSLNASVSERK